MGYPTELNSGQCEVPFSIVAIYELFTFDAYTVPSLFNLYIGPVSSVDLLPYLKQYIVSLLIGQFELENLIGQAEKQFPYVHGSVIRTNSLSLYSLVRV